MEPGSKSNARGTCQQKSKGTCSASALTAHPGRKATGSSAPSRTCQATVHSGDGPLLTSAGRRFCEILPVIWCLVAGSVKSYLVLGGNHVQVSQSMLFPFSGLNSLAPLQTKPQPWFPQCLALIYKPQRTSPPTWLEYKLSLPTFYAALLLKPASLESNVHESHYFLPVVLYVTCALFV